jgi:hypothetical protein
MVKMYCGNKANYKGLVSGTHFLGTNYKCLRKGIGVGLHLPYDSSYKGPYIPVDGRRFYCGNAKIPPPTGGYFASGSPSKCLSIGVGVGKSQKAKSGRHKFMFSGIYNDTFFIRNIIPYILFFVISGGFFVILYITKPKFLTKKDDKNLDIIDWNKFIPYYFIICLIIALVIVSCYY